MSNNQSNNTPISENLEKGLKSRGLNSPAIQSANQINTSGNSSGSGNSSSASQGEKK